jgi:hypothetical protein
MVSRRRDVLEFLKHVHRYPNLHSHPHTLESLQKVRPSYSWKALVWILGDQLGAGSLPQEHITPSNIGGPTGCT